MRNCMLQLHEKFENGFIETQYFFWFFRQIVWSAKCTGKMPFEMFLSQAVHRASEYWNKKPFVIPNEFYEEDLKFQPYPIARW